MATAVSASPAAPSADDVASVQRCEQAYRRLRDELAKVIVGQDDVIEQVLVAIHDVQSGESLREIAILPNHAVSGIAHTSRGLFRTRKGFRSEQPLLPVQEGNCVFSGNKRAEPAFFDIAWLL